ncbi:Phosphatidylinositol 4-kinase STT4 [Rhodotorula toruloides]|uniref:1-phosphatidylinositol 4-kinase n=1 Tax=Rhodotorula toruloides TaxID=5286 RepID=A0A0K3CFU3_RHOTO|nr:Phosphatidylinositol 4-kinase STT4 [Rhodotorula toruloides]PRQ73592.1 hypothetical protein AAT19DRAFT_15159 [Rhodotorula toruloides]
MDYLDGNLHQSLLTALAANLASTSEQDDLALLTTSFSSLEPVSNTAIHGVLSRMNGAYGAGEGELVTNDQLEGMIAFAEYSSSAEHNQAQAGQVVKLLQGIPRWSLEPALGVQASYDWAPADRLSFALTDAAFRCADLNGQAREAVIKSVQFVQAELERQARDAPGPRTISYVLPALNGLRRAIPQGHLRWTAADPQPSILSFDDPAVTHLRSIFANSSDLDLSSEEGRIALATLEKYQFIQPGLSPTLPLLASLEIQQAYWSSFLSAAKTSDARWKEMLVGSGKQTDKSAMPQQIAAEGVAQKALEIWQRVVRAIENEDEMDDEVDLQPTPLLVASLTLAVTASVVARKLEPDLLGILESVLHPESAGIDESIQVAGSQALQVIAHGFPERLTSATEIIRRFLLSPALRPSDDPSTLTPALQTATEAYSALLARSDSSSRTSAIQTLLNHLASIERQGHVPNGDSFVDAASTIGSVRRYGGDTAEVAANIVHVVSLLARKSGETSLTRLVGSTLLHYAMNGSVLVQCAALIELREIAAVSDKHAYVESLRTVTGVARTATGGDDISYQTAISALTQLASIAAKKHEELGFSFLSELLTLFGNKGAESAGSSEERTQMLLALVAVLDSYLTQVSFDASSVISSALGALFRGFWYTCLLSGFLSSPQRLSAWQRGALLSVAKRSPPLVVSVSQDLVELEAQVQAILKSASSHSMSVEAIRGDLANGIPSQATHARSISAPQAVFLTTAYRLESLRAEAGAIAPLFLYFGVPALSGESAVGDTLKSIGDKVLSVYMARLGQQVPLHAMDSSAYVQVRTILLHTTNSSESMRSTALRFLDNILASFPSLVCNLGVVTVMLELLTVLRRACLDEFTDEYTPSFEFHSTRGNFTITLSDDYPLRNRILRNLHEHVRSWLKKGITRSPLEMQGLLQEYVDVTSDGYRMQMLNDDEMGKSVALDLVKTPPANGKYASLPAWGNWNADASTAFARTFAAKSFFGGEVQRGATNPRDVLDKLEDLAEQLDKHKLHFKLSELRDLFYRGAAQVVKAQQPDFEVLRHVVSLPVRLYTEASIAVGQEIWTWIADARPELEPRVVSEVLEAWADAIEREQGLFSRTLDNDTPLNQETQFTPTDKEALNRDYLFANRLFSPMLAMLDFLQSRYQAYRYRNADLVYATLRLLLRTLEAHENWSRHPLSRELRLTLLSFGFTLIGGSRLDSIAEYNLRAKLFDAAFAWFEVRPTWSFGNNRIQIKADLQAIDNLLQAVQADSPNYDVVSSSFEDSRLAPVLPDRASASSAKEAQRLRQQLLKALLSDEAERLRLWLNPLLDSKRGAVPTGETPGVEELRKLARFAWTRWPKVVVFLHERFKLPPLLEEVVRVIRSDPLAVQDCPDALPLFVGESLSLESRSKFRHLLYWAPVPVPEALRFLFPKFGGDPILLQYALRVLEHHPVAITFFYVPQVVQALRTDELGYAERFIFETSKISQLFCHQIIWNMKANAYRGDDAEEADPMKPKLDRLVDMIVESLSGEAQDFYNREFTFFDEVTSISGKLKPFIKSPKPEKKAKIDEEMAKIKVDVGVYLPSNPDGVVVDINRTSGRPLQSHAKAPFMATFKVRRTRHTADTDDLEAQDELIDVEEGAASSRKQEYDTWQSAIFKVGDDCRQDVLALQIVAMHKNIWNSLGLDLLVTPYRVTATGPGMGVIDVIPNATSRDEMGRAKINDLLSFFKMKFGPVESADFQRARNHFIQSMAAYSVLCFIIQIKDRHNGNIMVDAKGNIVHIDFGFLFDIGPGGVKFEPSSFKLTHEMLTLMGGKDSVGYRHFKELTVKAFLAARPYAQSIVDTVALMLAAEFPSFKGEPTLERLKGRFRLDLSEKKAAEWWLTIVDDACENKRSIVYDEFQRITNGIPYVR